LGDVTVSQRANYVLIFITNICRDFMNMQNNKNKKKKKLQTS